MIRISFAAIALATAAVRPAAAAPVIVPGSAATHTGSNGGFPFNITPFGATSQHYQQFYAGSAFGTGPIAIYGIAFRPSSDAQSKAFSATLPAITIGLSTARTTIATASTTFADNIGTDSQTVVNGPLTLSSARTGAPGHPQKFDIVIPFASPFAYDPTKGALLLDVLNTGAGTTTQFDFFTGGAPDLAEIFTFPSQGSANPTGFIRRGSGLPTEFLTSPIGTPEPAAALFGLVGVALLATTRRVRR